MDPGTEPSRSRDVLWPSPRPQSILSRLEFPVPGSPFPVRLVLGIAALVIFVVLAVRDRMPQEPAVTPAPAASDSAARTIRDLVRYARTPARSVLTVQPHEMVDVIRATRRVRPDRRFLLAVADVHGLLIGAERRPVHVEWRDNRWAIEYGDARESVGSLPDLPSLADARAMLAQWAATLAKARPLSADITGQVPLAARVRSAADSLSAPSTIRALTEIDEQWRRSRDPRLLTPAAEALSALALYVEDRADMADALYARALASSVLARTFTSESPRRTDVLLAHAMGYYGEADDSARALPLDDPIRRFFEHADSSLVSLARRDNAEPIARYLAITRAAEGGTAAWLSARSMWAPWRGQTTVALRSGLSARDFDLDQALPTALATALQQLTKWANQGNASGS